MGGVRNLIAKHVGDIRARIADLEAMERLLSDAICECASRQQPGCPIMDVLLREPQPPERMADKMDAIVGFPNDCFHHIDFMGDRITIRRKDAGWQCHH